LLAREEGLVGSEEGEGGVGEPAEADGVRSQDERTDDAVPFSRWKRDAARGMHLRDETFPCSPFSVTARHGFLFAEQSCRLRIVVRRIMLELEVR
jgi:hypothetical protein